VAHARLAVRYQVHKYSHVLTLLPRVITEYGKYGMVTEENKARYLYASTLKAAGDSDAALAEFLSISNNFGDQEAAFRALVLTSVAEEYARRNSDEAADEYYQAAISAVELSEDAIAEAHLKASVGEVYRSKGRHDQAVECLRSSASKYASLGMDSQAVYIRIVLAESLLAGNREREAEWEIVAALQTIESLRMVVEGYAAVELLRESVSRRQTDRSALSALRGQIKNSR
jgi:tetratricopeptide (TPR) repeat protein